jgi:6-phosphogluconolactonase
LKQPPDQACADYILATLTQALETNPTATVAISGGSSPRPMFQRFAQTPFPWDRVHLFWVDERAVPPTDAESNFKLANDTWLTPGNFPKQNIHRIQAELEPHQAAERYIHEIREHFHLKDAEIPVFDVIHQGMGPDGHTASLFPGEPLINLRTGVAAAVFAEKFKQWRITLLPAVLIAARHTAMLVTGADKAPALRAVLDGDYDPLHWPTQVVSRNAPDVAWFLDESLSALAPRTK